MKIKILIAILLLTMPTVLACRTPLIFNEHGVPVSLYGQGYLIVNGTKYPDQEMVQYNLTVNNTDDEGITFSLSPSSDLTNYVYGGTYEVGAKQKKNITIHVYVNGHDKVGEVYVTGQCASGIPIVEGVMNVKIYGKGIQSPQYCGNNVKSCGVWPNCQDISTWSGCYQGYKRDYYCAANSPRYTLTCTDYCCRQHVGEDGYCYGNVCHGSQSCENECDFSGLKCQGGDVYSCQMQLDGCYDLILEQECGSYSCYDGACIDESAFHGKIAYLCANNECNEDLEQQLIRWLRSTRWMVTGKAYNSWTYQELNDYDIIVCSDEQLACKTESGSVAYKQHKTNSKPLLEVADYRYANGAFRLGYVNNPYEYLHASSYLTITGNDIITKPFSTKTQIFSSAKKMVIVPDYRLSSSVIDLADVDADNGRSTLFKVKQQGSQGRYAYIGWFYAASISDLTSVGLQLLNRTVVWTECGDACLSNPNENQPPVAISVITPNPIGYENQIIQFDASQSYDPEGQPLKYYWDFGDDTNSGWMSASSTTHVYSMAGEYHVTLMVNDGELNSEPDITKLTILPIVKNRVAFICKSNSCSEQSEQNLIAFLKDNGYSIKGKSEYAWTSEELNNYDFMICSSAGSGCNIHSFSAVYDKHINGMKGFLEVPDYQYIRAGYRFGYTSWFTGYSTQSKNIKIVGTDPITNGYSGTVSVLKTNGNMFGIFRKSLKSSVTNLADITDKDASTEFKVEPSGNRGRYAYVGWSPRTLDLTDHGKEILLRTIRWVQCGNPRGCE